MANHNFEILEASLDALKAHMTTHKCLECDRHRVTMLSALERYVTEEINAMSELLGKEKEKPGLIKSMRSKLGGLFNGD